MMMTVIKKELRGYFNSAVAVIFISVFLAATLLAVFGWQKFFARGLADVRPLFEVLPVVLIVLVSALSMRLWAEERRAGTLEVLLTLPVPRWQLVVGKFLAGLALIGVALVLTLGLPITISRMGNLDWGPVFGGYLAALLLSAAYLAIGMCVSAATDNQIVAFIGTAAACAASYGVGLLGPVGRLLGTGTRFESIARGVLDLRDLAYYAGLVGVGIAVNVLLLQRLTWSDAARGRARRLGTWLALGLVVGNALALDLWLAPVHRARIDLTQGGTFSLSDSTRKILGGLDERLLIRGYFSERVHPKLGPLVPALRDLLEEYRIAGNGKVKVEIVDPTDSDEAKRDAKELFGIDPTPMRFATNTEQSVVNAYFAIAVQYGDQHAVITHNDLIAVRPVEVGNVEISLKNPEYEITKTIKKTVSEFSSIDTLFASMPGKIKLTAYITPKTLPDELKDGPAKLKQAVDELAKQSNGKIELVVEEPAGDAQMRELAQKYGLRPHPVDLFASQVYYFDFILQVGERLVRFIPKGLGDAELKTAITESVKRAAPGFTRVVGLWTPPPGPPQPQMQGMPPQQMPPPQTFESLRRALSGNYEVREVALNAAVPDEVEALVLAGPAQLDAKAAEYVDQFVMRGGALVALAGRYRLAPGAGLAVEKVTTGIDELLQKWGVTVGQEMVLDAKSDAFPIPENRDLGNGMVVRELRQLPYPFFVKMDGDQLGYGSLITGGLDGAVMHWGSPVKAERKVGDDAHAIDELLTSSDNAWLTTSTVVQPDPRLYPETGFPPAKPEDKKGAQVLAVAVSGGFASAVAKPKTDKPDPAAAKTPAPRLMEHSPPETRLVVFGSSAFVSDDILQLAQQLGSDLAVANLELVHNAVDWALADTDLLAIRSHNTSARPLTIEPSSAQNWIILNVLIALAGLAVVVWLGWMRRRGVRPIALGKEA